MKKSIYQLIREQKTDWQDFCEIIGLKNTMQQLAVGAALGILLLIVCGVGEWVASLF